MLKFFALFALTVLATANAASAVTGASVTRENVMSGKKSGDLVVKFTPTTALAAGGTITLTADSFTQEDFFSADASTPTCTVTLATGSAPTLAGAVTGNTQILTLTLASGGTIAAGVETTLTCDTAAWANNGAVNNVVRFIIKTSADTTDVGGVPGYTVTAKSVTAFSASRGSVVAGEAGGFLTFKFTPTSAIAADGTITLTPSQGLFSASDASTQCTATPATTNPSTPRLFTSMITGSYWTADGYLGMTLTLTHISGGDLPADEEATVVCTSNLAKNSATVSSDGDGAGDVKFSISTSADAHVLAGQTGYTLTAATSAASSTSSVSMLTMLALAGLAMRQ